ncbi:hypothetical protein BYT27DRAFT_7229884 [Phlegmacium glaucopus]|nr:hypothetical protein BYT27DRAFT_7229884 [Phlegmacium glaucopus]
MATTQLPGFGRRLDYIPNEADPEFINKPFPSALSTRDVTDLTISMPMMALREFAMLQLMNEATDKIDWNIKLQNPEFSSKWKEEALSSGPDITPKMADWCLDELRYNASLIPPDAPAPPIFVFNGDVFKSDNAVSAELKKALQENVPGSHEKVWDLVHPSLFPLVYGRTRVLSDGETTTLEDCIQRCGKGEVTSIPIETLGQSFHPGTRSWYNYFRRLTHPYSDKFQCLPCEVDISEDQARITSYINNLHPQKEKPLYEIISQLITASIPLWELTLAPLVQGNKFSRSTRIVYTRREYDPDTEERPETEGPRPESNEDENENAQKTLVRPEPEAFEPLPSPPTLNLRAVYGKRGLQVIVKLANIELTPDKPNYDGGSWHIEGHMNEHIVATALYYYSNDNITSSSLSFRQQCDGDEVFDMDYEQDRHEWLDVVFGYRQNGPRVQDVGSVDTPEGRLLTFPNVLQHRVGSFKLVDPTKPGHRKIVISTAHVPCQRKDWWIEAILEKQSTGVHSQDGVSSPGQVKRLNDLPFELQDLIFKQIGDFPISMEDAEKLRLKFMKERREFLIPGYAGVLPLR